MLLSMQPTKRLHLLMKPDLQLPPEVLVPPDRVSMVELKKEKPVEKQPCTVECSLPIIPLKITDSTMKDVASSTEKAWAPTEPTVMVAAPKSQARRAVLVPCKTTRTPNCTTSTRKLARLRSKHPSQATWSQEVPKTE